MSKLADVSHQPLVLIETPGLCLHESSSLYAHGNGGFLSEARLCASDPVPCFFKIASKVNPCVILVMDTTGRDSRMVWVKLRY